MHSKRVGLINKRQLYRCLECKETFFADLPDIDANRSVTNRLKDWIQTVTSIADDIGVDEKTVEIYLMTTLRSLKHKQISEHLNGLVLMKSIYLKTTVV